MTKFSNQAYNKLKENNDKALCLFFIFTKLYDQIKLEQSSSHGCINIIVIFDKLVFIIEFKVVASKKSNITINQAIKYALKQIDDKR